jgi:hypothetical protein
MLGMMLFLNVQFIQMCNSGASVYSRACFRNS